MPSMEDQHIADPTFGLSTVSRAVMALLDVYPSFLPDEEDSVRFSTYPWYNGREKGVAIVMWSWENSDRSLIVTFGECRSSDLIFVDSWEDKRYFAFNGPTVKDFTDEAYNNRWTTLNPQAAANRVISYMDKFYKSLVKEKIEKEKREAKPNKKKKRAA